MNSQVDSSDHRMAVGSGAILARDLRRSSAATVCRIVGIALLTAIAAQIAIPVGRVPVTLQTVAVLLAGFLLRPREAGAAMGLYLAVGAAGAPVFALGRFGLGGPTTGYLLAFLPASMLVSLLSDGHADRIWRLIGSALAGLVVIFACGVAWLSAYPGGLAAALGDGLLPFVLLAPAKAGLAIAAVCSGRALGREVARRRRC